MTETDWLVAQDPEAMLPFLRGDRTSLEILESPQGRSFDRKARLFSVACCRRLWPMLVEERLRAAVLTAERHADGQASDAEMGTAVKAAHRFSHSILGRAVYAAALFHPGAAIFRASAVAQAASQAVAWYAVRLVPSSASPRSRPREQQAKAQAAEQAAQCILLRDIFGPLPYRPVTVSPFLLGWNDHA